MKHFTCGKKALAWLWVGVFFSILPLSGFTLRGEVQSSLGDICCEEVSGEVETGTDADGVGDEPGESAESPEQLTGSETAEEEPAEEPETLEEETPGEEPPDTASTENTEDENSASHDIDGNMPGADVQDDSLTASDGTPNDVNRVMLEWTIEDISVTRTDNKIWDVDNLTWTTDEEGYGMPDVTAGSAKITLTNLSSVKVNVTVTFEQESGFTAPSVDFTEGTTDGAVTLGAFAEDDKTTESTIDHDAVIGVTITPEKADFKTLDATTGTKYGTYTITLSSSQN